MRKGLYALFLLLCHALMPQYTLAQNTDSLWKVYYNNSLADTSRLKAIHEIAWSLRGNKPDSAIILAEEELQLAKRAGARNYESKALGNLGMAALNKGDFPKALERFLTALKIAEEVKDKRNLGVCYNSIGIVYYYQAKYPKAIEYFLKNLKIQEELGDKKGMGSSCNNLGVLYQSLSDLPKALEFDQKALKIAQETGDKQGEGNSLCNIGIVYKNQSKDTEALEYYLKALKVYEEIGHKQGIGLTYIYLSEVYNKLGEHNSNNYKDAIKYADLALKISGEIKAIEGQRQAHQNLSHAYSKTGNYKGAYESHVKFKTLTDSIFNVDNSKQLGDMKTKFEVEKKEAELKVKAEAEQEKLKALASEEKKRQNVIIFSVVGVLLLVIVFSVFLFNRFRVTSRQKIIIEKQKEQVDKAYENLHEKNKEVMDSINYASRIQRALLPSQRYIANNITRLMKSN